jgi:hypothetical protein
VKHAEESSKSEAIRMLITLKVVFTSPRPPLARFSGLCAMGVTGIWLGLKQRSLTQASFSAFFYFLLLPASLYVLRPTSPARITLVLVIAYCAIAVVMHRKLSFLVQGGDSVQRLLRRPEW